MIIYPKNWRKIGVKIAAREVERRLIDVLQKINCNNLSFSGGVDSSLLLYYMCQVFDRVNLFTMVISESHPDATFAKSVVADYKRKFFGFRFDHYFYYPKDEEIKDTIYELFYRWISKHTKKIITGDTIDEYMCGYYAHMTNPIEEVYYDYIRRLQKDHLIPLNRNSAEVGVCLPYADEEVIAMLSQIPLKDKVDLKNRKKMITEMAKGKVPDGVIMRRKYGFCDALIIKE